MYRSQKTNTRLRTPLRKGNASIIQSCWSFNGCCVRSMDALKLCLSYRSWKNLPQACVSKNMIISNTCTYVHAHVCSRNVLQHKWCWYWWEQTQSCLRLYKHMYITLYNWIYIYIHISQRMYEHVRTWKTPYFQHTPWQVDARASVLLLGGANSLVNLAVFSPWIGLFSNFLPPNPGAMVSKTLVLLGFQSSNMLIVILLF